MKPRCYNCERSKKMTSKQGKFSHVCCKNAPNDYVQKVFSETCTDHKFSYAAKNWMFWRNYFKINLEVIK